MKRWACGLILLITLSLDAYAFANTKGVYKNSGREGETCATCHTGGTPPTVSIDGLDVPLQVGVTTELVLHINGTTGEGTGRVAGFGAAVPLGAGKFTNVSFAKANKDDSSELRHSAAKALGATAGYDAGLDLYAPPPPPAGVFDAALGLDGERYYTQIVPLESHEWYWDIHLQYPESGSITLSWNQAALLGLGEFTISDPFDGTILSVDMTATDSVVLTNPALTLLKLIANPSGEKSFDFIVTAESGSGFYDLIVGFLTEPVPASFILKFTPLLSGTFTLWLAAVDGKNDKEKGMADNTIATTFEIVVAGDGICAGEIDCDDNLVCTTDACDPVAGCVHFNNTLPCDDGDACSEGDVCNAGVCAGENAVECNDNNLCTDDSCDAETGCVNANNFNVGCDDGDACSTVDLCIQGKCQGSTPLDCEDGNACTDDSCNSVDGCIHAFTNSECDDLDTCTTSDACEDGSCKGGSPLDCDDGNPCTVDDCDAQTGCSSTNSNAACDDGISCTVNDSCANGACAGQALECDPGSYCEDGACVSVQCLPCAQDDDCGDGANCMATESGQRCLLRCFEDEECAGPHGCLPGPDGVLICVSDDCPPKTDPVDSTGGDTAPAEAEAGGCGCRNGPAQLPSIPAALIVTALFCLLWIGLRRVSNLHQSEPNQN